MKKPFRFWLLSIVLLSLFSFQPLLAQQNKKPKVALVLSGGGAKGIAHIKTLQVLDSLGIVPDLVIGTSMGSIVGGLYAMGYSGDSIAKIAQSQDWMKLLSGKLSLKDVTVEEKSQYEMSLLKLDWKNSKPQINPALLNDQNLREFFARISYPVFDINDFDKLPIPYRAIATDIVNGKMVVMDKGSIITAMRASMSIPTIFQPVEYDDVLLVDGGVLNNFPTDVAKQLGADIIIGSDVGGGMQPKEKLKSMSALLFQTSMLASNLKNTENQALCDILINHVPHLTYSTGDFDHSNEIYLEGFVAVEDNKDALASLSKSLKKFKQSKPKLPYKPSHIKLDTVVFKNVSPGNYNLLRRRINLQSGKTYSIDDIVKKVNYAMGTNVFARITYHPIIHGDKLGIEFTVEEKAPNRIGGAIHYDTYRGPGILLNYTGRNILGKASRMNAVLDVAEQPRLRIQYQKIFGKKMDYWFRSEMLGQRLIQQFYLDGKKADDIKYRYFQFENQINKNINPFNSYAGIHFNYENSGLKPVVDPEINDNIFNLDNYTFKNFEVGIHYRYNTTETMFHPKTGWLIQGVLSRSLYHNVDLTTLDETTIKGNTNGFTKLTMTAENRWKLSEKITAIAGINTGFTFVDQLKNNEKSFLNYGVAANYFLGGNVLRPRKSDYIFPGLHEGELMVTQFMMLNVNFQFEAYKNLVFIPHGHLASVGFNGFNDYMKTAFNPQGNWKEINETSALVSGGITTYYNSILGPITFDISWVNNINKVRLFFGLGIFFNRSN